MANFNFEYVPSASGALIAPCGVEVDPAVRVRRNGMIFPEEFQAASSFQAEVEQQPQSTPPRARPSVPSLQEAGAATSSRRSIIGVSPGPHPTPPPAPEYWTVVQRTAVRLRKGQRWVTGGLLGMGGFGRVYLVYSTATQEQCAMKIVGIRKRMPESCCRGLINELRVLSRLGSESQCSPFLLRPYLSRSHWAWTSSSRYLHILTEVCTGGDLFGYKNMLGFNSLTLVCAELVSAPLFT